MTLWNANVRPHLITLGLFKVIIKTHLNNITITRALTGDRCM